MRNIDMAVEEGGYLIKFRIHFYLRILLDYVQPSYSYWRIDIFDFI